VFEVRKKFGIGKQEVKEDEGEWGMPKWNLFMVINKTMGMQVFC